ncbi:hypothetical protein KY342_00400 [Candidatus Woesearchaeota archaeon]|nr:hypothetical protein [Candidatus Woesearchaeota archaeon]
MQNKIILYEPIELEKEIESEELDMFQDLKNDKSIKNLEVYVSFVEE